jgi:serine kinase of HPr protein (carbohydrate metabolism regulator)
MDAAAGRTARERSDEILERTALQRKIVEAFFDRDILLFHGSVVAVDGMAYLFAAKSGTGKSTHTRLWRQWLGDRAVMVNDDKPFLRFSPEGIFLCGAPWSGKHGLDTNMTVPLQGICILERGAENTIVPVSADFAADFLRHQCQLPLEADKMPLFTELFSRLMDAPLWRMACTISEDAPKIAYEAMK